MTEAWNIFLSIPVTVKNLISDFSYLKFGSVFMKYFHIVIIIIKIVFYLKGRTKLRQFDLL